MKITSAFLAPGAGLVIGWIITGIGYAKSLYDIIKKLIDAKTQFVNVYENDVLKANLIDKLI
jgi:uncharacterized membrane protein YciS (DUF1049 family)